MARSRTAARSPAPSNRRRGAPRQGWLQRNARWVALVAVAAVGLIAILLAAGDGGDGVNGAAAAGRTGPDFHSLVADPTNPDRVFVGRHQAVSVSLDGGRTWNEIDTLRDADAMGWGFADDGVYVSGHPGLNRSTDGGRSFARVNEGLPDTDIHAFGASGDVLYGAAVGVGVFTGTVGDWEVRTSEAGQSFFGRIVVDAAHPQHLFAADARGGVVESTDGGRSWQLLDSGLQAATWLSATPDVTTLVASGPAGAARSTDGGRSWEPLELPEGVSLVEIAAEDGNALYGGRHRGERVELLVSDDGGATWNERS